MHGRRMEKVENYPHIIYDGHSSSSPSACPHEGRFGSVPHAGFGVGFERLVMLATGVGTPGPRRSEELKSHEVTIVTIVTVESGGFCDVPGAKHSRCHSFSAISGRGAQLFDLSAARLRVLLGKPRVFHDFLMTFLRSCSVLTAGPWRCRAFSAAEICGINFRIVWLSAVSKNLRRLAVRI